MKPVTVSLHESRNSSKGTIFAPELRFMSEEELLDEMRVDGITHVRRITTFRDGERKDTSLLVLTFNSPRLPLKLTTGYLSFDVNVFVPNPLRCFLCQRFGHAKDKCKQTPRCRSCGQTPHEGSECTAPKKCVTCESTEHSTSSKECPVWKKEKRVCEVKVHRNVSYPEARKIVEAEMPSQKSYASAAAKETVSSSAQTDPIPQLEPLKLLPPVQPAARSSEAQTAQVTTASTVTSQSQARSQPQKTSHVTPRSSSRGRSPSRKTSGSRTNQEESSRSRARSQSSKAGSERQTHRSSSSRPPPPTARGAVGPPVGQGQFFSV